ncbi:EcsC family protein [Paenibacillus chartarius]|uniref:EcsC family protein n=1 Tax=Paenibacillus chartarius TaxID=747481 RepID=A0ABV6DS24_9BACL
MADSSELTETGYERHIRRELLRWEARLLKPHGIVQRAGKKVQNRINELLPDRFHDTVTAAVRGIFKAALFSMDYIPKQAPLQADSLSGHDIRAEKTLDLYRKLATVEGAGTGAGGIWLGLADFPLLIGIKVKFLFELAHAYGYRTEDFRERVFILYVFQLAFSSPAYRDELLRTIKIWSNTEPAIARTGDDAVDWLQLQQEYRDTIDFRKMLQLVPGIGAVVGAWANYQLLDELGETGMNCYRLRWLADHKKEGQGE